MNEPLTIDKWRETLPADLLEAPALKDVKDVSSLAKQFVDLQGHMGTSIRIPGKDAGEDAMKEFQSKLMEKVPGLLPTPKEGDDESYDAVLRALGKPEDKGNYSEVKVTNAKGEEVSVPEGIRDMAFEAGLTNAQYKKFATKMLERQVSSSKENDENFVSDINQLYLEWGGAKPQKIAQLGTLLRATKAPEELVGAIEGGTMNAKTLRWLDGIMEQIGGETNEMIQQHHGETQMTASEAQSQIAEIMARPEYFDRSSPLQAELVNKVLRLQAHVSGSNPEGLARYG